MPENDYTYILIEGPDRAGKDTQAELLVQRMQDEGQNPLLVAEPCENLPTGRLLRQLLKSGEYREAHVGLFFADRMALQANVIKPALDAGRPVVSVRSFLSTICYQAENWPLDWLYDIHRVMAIKPTHVVLLDVDSEEGQRRVGRDVRAPEVYEKIEIQRRVRQRYLDLTKDDRFWDCLAPNGWTRLIPEPPLGLSADMSKQMVHEAVWNFAKAGTGGVHDSGRIQGLG